MPKRKKRHGPSQKERKQGLEGLQGIALTPASMRTYDENLQQISLYQEYEYLKFTKRQLEASVNMLRFNHGGDEEKLRELAVVQDKLQDNEEKLHLEKFSEVAKNRKNLLDYLHELHRDQNGNRIW